MKYGGTSVHFGAGVDGGERPADRCGVGIAAGGPGGSLLLHGRPVAEPPTRALALGDGQLALGPVEPAAVLGRVVHLERGGQALGVGGRGVSGVLVQDHDDALGFEGVSDVHLPRAPGDVEPGRRKGPGTTPCSATAQPRV